MIIIIKPLPVMRKFPCILFVVSLLAAVVCCSCTPAPQLVADLAPGQKAEYDKARMILMHQPGDELFWGSVHPLAALFEVYFDYESAAREHAGYQRALESKGIEVRLVCDVLLQGTIDDNGAAVAGAALDDLRGLAAQCVDYRTESLSAEDAAMQPEYLDYVLRSATPQDLVRMILLRPTLTLRAADINTPYTAVYQLDPLMNLFYTRDQTITTAKGVVVGRMNSVQRRNEASVVEFCLRKLGMTPIGAIAGDEAFLEGGDFLPFGNMAFIGCGLRTTQAAIDQLMTNDWLGCDSLMVVRDHWRNQEQMHLDTYFNVIDRDLATLVENRFAADPQSEHYLTFDLYVRSSGGYEKEISEGSLLEYLARDLGMTVIPISAADSRTYANNFLTIGAREIMAVDGQSGELQQTLKNLGVKVTWVPLPSLIKGYGAAHCMTQVLVRE